MKVCTLIFTSRFIRVTDKNLYHIAGTYLAHYFEKEIKKKLIYLKTIIEWQSEKVIKNQMVNP